MAQIGPARGGLAVALAAAAVITAVTKWWRGGPAELGFGAPWVGLDHDREMRETAARTELGGPLPEPMQRAIVAISRRSDRGDRVQVRGAPRNVLWPLAYYVYPLPVVGAAREEGGTPDDPVRDDVQWLVTIDRDLRVKRIR